MIGPGAHCCEIGNFRRGPTLHVEPKSAAGGQVNKFGQQVRNWGNHLITWMKPHVDYVVPWSFQKSHNFSHV